MARRINSIPALGNPTTRKGVLGALGGPRAAIPNADGSTNVATLNATLSHLRSLGLIDSELVVNGSFDTDASAWAGGINPANGTFAWDSGGVSVTNTVGGLYSITQAIVTTPGSTYKLSGIVISVAGTVYLLKSDSQTDYAAGRADATPGAGTTTPGAFEVTFVADADTSYVHMIAGAGTSAVFDNISVTEV